MEMHVPPLHRADTVSRDRRPNLLLGAVQHEKGAIFDAERLQMLVRALTGTVSTFDADTIETVVSNDEESDFIVVGHRQFNLLRSVPAVALGIDEVADADASIPVPLNFVAGVASEKGERLPELLKVLLGFPKRASPPVFVGERPWFDPLLRMLVLLVQIGDGERLRLRRLNWGKDKGW